MNEKCCEYRVWFAPSSCIRALLLCALLFALAWCVPTVARAEQSTPGDGQTTDAVSTTVQQPGIVEVEDGAPTGESSEEALVGVDDVSTEGHDVVTLGEDQPSEGGAAVGDLSEEDAGWIAVQSAGYDNSGTARAISVNTVYAANMLNGSDADWYRFTTTDDGHVSLNFAHDYDRGHSWSVYLYKPGASSYYRNWWYDSDVMDANETTCEIGLPAGTYYVKVTGSSTKTYRLRVNFAKSAVWEREAANDDPSGATPISLNKTHYGSSYSNSDNDWWRLTASEAGKYRLTFAHEYDSSHSWSVYLYDSSASSYSASWYIRSSDSTASRNEITLAKGTYYFKVTGSSTKTYSMLLVSPSNLANASFNDVSDRTDHAEDIMWMAEVGISQGWAAKNGKREFRPYANVARADMAAFLFRLAMSWGMVKDTWQPAGSISFSDVNSKTSHYREIMWLAESGISEGWSVGKRKEFRPMANVARADMAAFIARLWRNSGKKTSGSKDFTDVTNGVAHAEDIRWLAYAGISAGWDNGDGTFSFRPYANVARADMAAFLHRLDGLRDQGGQGM